MLNRVNWRRHMAQQSLAIGDLTLGVYDIVEEGP